MRIQGQGGFTVIELTLFLAISGLLLAVALLGTGSTIRAMRFTDSARSLHSFVQKQYDEIFNGVNPRSGAEACAASLVTPNPGIGDTPGASKCLLLGKFVKFTTGSSTVQIYNIVGSEPLGPVADNLSDEQLVVAYRPSVVRSVTSDSYTIPWLATVSGMKRPGDGKNVDTYALIRSPNSSRILSYTFVDDTSKDSLVGVLGSSFAQLTNICVKSADGFGSPAKITVSGSGQGQDSVEINFDAIQAVDCDGL